MSESVPPSSRSIEESARLAGDPSVRRKLLTGLALILALGSIYSGMLGVRAVQLVLAAAAMIAVASALMTRSHPKG
jgi:hypothetical protein